MGPGRFEDIREIDLACKRNEVGIKYVFFGCISHISGTLKGLDEFVLNEVVGRSFKVGPGNLRRGWIRAEK